MMKTWTIKCVAAGLLVFLVTACSKKTWDEFYNVPDNLSKPIYAELQAKGTFTQLLSVIDKAGYKNTLSSAGYWTFFAPNDSAFKAYFAANNTSVEKMDSSKARALIQFMLVYNAFNKNTIDDYQSSTGWVPDQAFRRRTAYYTGFYDDTMQNGTVVKTIQSNRNTGYITGDNNNKYIPCFTDIYFGGKGLTAADYNYFYPNTSYAGFNIAEAKVINQDLNAQNGVIHEIDRVLTPLPSIEEYLRSKPEYSEFRKLFDKYMVSFVLNSEATNRYKLLTGDSKQVYVKVYNTSLAFSPNSENFLKLQDNDAQQSSWTMFVPKNEVLLDYEKNVLLEYYQSFDNTPTSIILDFLNAHMWQTPVWPSQFKAAINFVGEEARFDPRADIIDRRILSNGMFYGTSKVQDANVFSTVYSRAYLDPKFSIMIRLLNTDLRYIITNPKAKFTLFMMPDAVLRAAGYNYDVNSNLFTYTSGSTTVSGESVRQTLLRILNSSVVSENLTSLAGAGITETYNGEFIKWNNMQVMSAGTQDASVAVNVDSTRTTKNGTVYYLNGLLTYSSWLFGKHIMNLGGTSVASDFYYFSQFLNNSGLYNATTGEITGTTSGTLYTVFVPSNAAIKKAVMDGVLPGNVTTGVPNLTASTWTAAEKDRVANFILYHILAKYSLIPNGKESGSFETLLKNGLGEVIPVTVISQPGSMLVNDVTGRAANVVVPQSNNLSNRTIIHLIDNYLKYSK
ncbi:fasciclin domain-containing protein [Niabella soli]|uniref:fasciclin domain-containing protein n=1 Tax=Niabella soli TaxID=446683 RepID=UPI00024991FD|nr:fasciclin domain-containing protein [Niabella soli]